MPRPRFSDMLYDRRRELGLSIKQASNVLRLKEEVLIAFEEGDFTSIPKSGYAQGMLSSYARYLGLNAKTVVNQFAADLIEHERGSNSHEARRRNRQNRNSADGPLYQTPQAGTYGTTPGNRLYFESRGFLPTSGGFAGDMGDFATTSAARPRYASVSLSRDEEPTYPQGGAYAAGSQFSVGQPAIGQVRANTNATSGRQGTAYGQGRHNGGSRGRSGSFDNASSQRYGTSGRAGGRRAGSGRGSARNASGTRQSSGSSRVQTPGTRRQTSSYGSRSASTRTREVPPRSDGLMGLIEEFLSDRTRVMFVGIVALCLIVLLVIITSVSSCVRGRQSTDRTVSVTASDQEEKSEEQTTTSVTDEEEAKARAEAAAAKAAETESSSAERTIEVTIADGEVTWIEIEYDGKSDIAETVTGPWNRTYTVRQSITISASEHSVVSVTEGGKKLEFDNKSSGIGTISIQVAKKSDVDTDADKDGAATGDASTTDGTTTQGDGAPSQDQGTGQTDEGSYDESGDDGYTYTEYGYYDQYGNFYEYE